MKINLLLILNRFVKPNHAGSSSLLFFNIVISCNGELIYKVFFYISTFYQLNILNSSITSVYLSIINHINKYYAQRFLNFHKLPKKILHLFLFQDRGIIERCDSDTQCENGTTNSFCNETSGFCQCKAGSLFMREPNTCSPGQ